MLAAARRIVLPRLWLPALALLPALVVLLLVLTLWSLQTGPVELGAGQVLQSLWHAITLQDIQGQEDWIVRELRLPRTLLAILVGAGLAAAGAVTQGVFRNPLADPGLIGVSSG